MRYFFVIQSGGQLPFRFIEIVDNGYEELGTLCNEKEMKNFWDKVLKLSA